MVAKLLARRGSDSKSSWRSHGQSPWCEVSGDLRFLNSELISLIERKIVSLFSHADIEFNISFLASSSSRKTT